MENLPYFWRGWHLEDKYGPILSMSKNLLERRPEGALIMAWSINAIPDMASLVYDIIDSHEEGKEISKEELLSRALEIRKYLKGDKLKLLQKERSDYALDESLL